MDRARAMGTAIALLVTGLAAGGCGGDSGPADAGDSGIRGTVLIGPTCAVEVVGRNCADKPCATALRIIDPGIGERVATASSDANGHFEVVLPAGRYRIEPQGPDSLPRLSPVEVTVLPDRYEPVTIHFDSGIR